MHGELGTPSPYPSNKFLEKAIIILPMAIDEQGCHMILL